MKRQREQGVVAKAALKARALQSPGMGRAGVAPEEAETPWSGSGGTMGGVLIGFLSSFLCSFSLKAVKPLRTTCHHRLSFL